MSSEVEVLNSDYWRLASNIFIHGGLIHLLMNLFGLAIGCSPLEYMLGSVRLAISFIACGVLAGIISICWNENTINVDASGGIFGLYGLILTFTVFGIYPKSMRQITWILLGLYAGTSLLVGMLGGIDNATHIGGLVSGFILGIVFLLINKEELKGKA